MKTTIKIGPLLLVITLFFLAVACNQKQESSSDKGKQISTTELLRLERQHIMKI